MTELYYIRRQGLIFIEKNEKKYPECDEFVEFIGGGGLAGYICPWLPHLP
jgi:hypothetical protein